MIVTQLCSVAIPAARISAIRIAAVAWPLSLCGLSVQTMLVNLGIEKLELILGPSCASEKYRCRAYGPAHRSFLLLRTFC